jgi:hypothetical protein
MFHMTHPVDVNRQQAGLRAFGEQGIPGQAAPVPGDADFE